MLNDTVCLNIRMMSGITYSLNFKFLMIFDMMHPQATAGPKNSYV